MHPQFTGSSRPHSIMTREGLADQTPLVILHCLTQRPGLAVLIDDLHCLLELCLVLLGTPAISFLRVEVATEVRRLHQDEVTARDPSTCP